MSYRLANSLKTLRDQLNAAYPNRSKRSDGWIGDAAHRSRKSDHNPWIDDNGLGVVSAFDFTHDPQGGIDCNKLADDLINSRDPRIKYIIWNGRILSSLVEAWRWRNYTGRNQHRQHLHISVSPSKGLYDSAREWQINAENTAAANFDHFANAKLIEAGNRGEAVRELQKKLVRLGYLKANQVDAVFGEQTKKAVLHFQSDKGLRSDGMAGSQTKAAILNEISKLDQIKKNSADVPAVNPQNKSDSPNGVANQSTDLPTRQDAGDQQFNPDSAPSTKDQPSETMVSVKDGDVEVKTKEGIEPPKKVAIEKPEPQGFISTIKKEISALVGGNIAFQAVIDTLRQIKEIGLSQNFWITVSLILATGSVIYLIYRYLDFRSDQKRDLDITNKLIEANSDETNKIILVNKDLMDEASRLGYEVVGR